jgi:hypothetical protein
MSDEPWKSEPKEIDFIDSETGYPCALRRGPMGHWCGYIGVPRSHPWHGKDYNHKQDIPPDFVDRFEATIDDVGAINVLCAAGTADLKSCAPIVLLIRCHGGLTFADRGAWISDAATWWLGFDCAHSEDLCPGSPFLRGGIYRDVAYVEETCRRAAKDIARFAEVRPHV